MESEKIVAIKEKLNENELSNAAWKNEIEILEYIKNKKVSLFSPNFIATIDDNETKIKDKYIVMDFFKGKIFYFIYILFIFFFFFLFLFLFLFIFFFIF